MGEYSGETDYVTPTGVRTPVRVAAVRTGIRAAKATVTPDRPRGWPDTPDDPEEWGGPEEWWLNSPLGHDLLLLQRTSDRAEEASRAYGHWVVADPTAVTWGKVDLLAGTGPYGYCFDNAWRLAATGDGLDYAEGVVLRDGVQPESHAWCVDRQGRIVEATESYGHPGERYRGWRLRKSRRTGQLALWTVWREAYELHYGQPDMADLVRGLRRLIAPRWW